MKKILAAMGLALAMFASAVPAEKKDPVPPRIESVETYNGKKIPQFNRVVLEIVKSIPADATHTYNWPKGNEAQHDGVTAPLFLAGTQVMKADPEGRTYCCGLTLEVFLRAYNQWVTAHGEPENATLTPETWSRFKTLWFVEEANGPGPSAALEKYNLGRTIPMEEAMPGDFVQIWRRHSPDKKNGSGHSVIFLDWVRDDAGAIKGLRYWSTQPGTQGVSENTEYFAPKSATEGVGEEISYFARVEIPAATPKAGPAAAAPPADKPAPIQ